MSDDLYIYHITVTTGHARRSYRREISSDAMRVVARLLNEIKGNPEQRITLPGFDGYEITGRISGRCMTAKVFKRGSFDPLVSIAVADRERCGATLWREMVVDKPQPDSPWIAAKIERGMMFDLGAAQWLGDFERCLAWAFIDYEESEG